MSTKEQHPAETDAGTSLLLEISNAMVRVYKDQFGRGPERARALWAGPDALVVYLERTLTPAERNLIRLGEHERVRNMRIFFQYSAVEGFCNPIEQFTGRKVRAFLSGIDTQADGLSIESFVLHPKGYDGPSRTEITDAGASFG
ncbi:DUF2294 domain-containing protein [Solirubrobacter taibaiensis]|nr:DUF2294 domain-containing protein [Solirubrobacter taibaiensis]